VTPYIVVSCIINYGSTRIVTVMKKDDGHSLIQMYSLKDFEVTFEESFTGDYIKMLEVQQNSSGDFFAAAYMDDGKFRVRTFGFETRTQEEIEREELKINEIFGIDDYSLAIDNFQDPFITCCFIDDSRLFINFMYTFT